MVNAVCVLVSCSWNGHVERDCIRIDIIRYCVNIYISQGSKVCKKSMLQSEQQMTVMIGGKIKGESKSLYAVSEQAAL